MLTASWASQRHGANSAAVGAAGLAAAGTLVTRQEAAVDVVGELLPGRLGHGELRLNGAAVVEAVVGRDGQRAGAGRGDRRGALALVRVGRQVAVQIDLGQGGVDERTSRC